MRCLFRAIILLTFCTLRFGPLEAAAPPMASLKYREGVRLMGERQWEAARTAFEESLDIQASPNTRLQIGRCERELGRVGRAYQHLRRAAHEAQDQLLATRDRRYQETQRAASREAEALDRRVPRLILVPPEWLPEDTLIVIDDQIIPRTALGLALEVDPGERTISLTGSRLKPLLLTQQVGEGEMLRLELRPERLPTATVTLVLPVRPAGLVVTVDGRPVPPARLLRRQYLDVGPHQVEASAPGFVTFRWRQHLSDGDVIKVPIELRFLQGTPRAAFIAMASAALVGLGLGAGLGINARLSADSEKMLPQEQRSPETKDTIHQQWLVSTVSLVVGGSFAVAAAALAFTTNWRSTIDARPRLSLRPLVSGATQGLLLEGRF